MKCEVMGFCLKLATSKKRGGLPLLRGTKICQNAPRGVTLDVHKCVFVHFARSPQSPRHNVLCTCLCTSSNRLLLLPFGLATRLPFWCLSLLRQ